MAEGAFESAERLLVRLLAEHDSFERGGARSRAIAVETLLMLGERARAAQLTVGHELELAATARGASVLELVGSSAAPDWLPNGHPNLLRLSRRLERGDLSADDLARLLGTSPWHFVRNPEVGLLFFSALVEQHSARALRFLNFYLAAHQLAPARWRTRGGTGEGALAQLHFSGCRRRASGPLVSVLVAAHNAATTVGYALDSLTNQSYVQLEILVGDDASQDGTLDVLKQRASLDARIRVFRSQSNQGAYNVRNALARHARGNLLTFHDADDLALPERLACQVERLMASPSAVACLGNFARLRPAGTVAFFKDQRAVRLGLVTLMLTREAFDAVGPFRSARFGADLELHAALRARFGATAIARVRSPLMLGSWSTSSATQSPGGESLADGYRSPARRAYSELVFQAYAGGATAGIDEAGAERLRALGNYAEPSELLPAPG